MIIECSKCESKVDGISKGEYEFAPEELEGIIKIALLQCPVCNEAILGFQEWYQQTEDRGSWLPATKLWPKPEISISWDLPKIVRSSLEEASKCYHAKAYSACAVMCGRALEGVCKEYNTKSQTMLGGLKELLDKKVIDERLFQWGEELRKHRNIGAHVTEEEIITKEDARDLLEFFNAICEYVFILDKKFRRFIERKKQIKK